MSLHDQKQFEQMVTAAVEASPPTAKKAAPLAAPAIVPARDPHYEERIRTRQRECDCTASRADMIYSYRG